MGVKSTKGCSRRGWSRRGCSKSPVCLQISHWRREGGQELSKYKAQEPCSEGWGGTGKKAAEHQRRLLCGLPWVSNFPSHPNLLIVRLQTWLSERLQQKLMYDKGSLPPTPQFLVEGCRGLEIYSYLYRGCLSAHGCVLWLMQQRVQWRGYGSLPGSKRHCLLEGCVKGNGSSQGRRGLWKSMSLAGGNRRV